ncbi:DUF2066 domain-containing protein [Aeromonas cavernicola]|uniref:DUF2066 domain-containing protein n=1 Tax=Aeromonas cavernicola TaxID=1006623 RepID=A0A2H9U4R1_9GAMM|nr:DUF2066 domain-containing protein [Aeromonas cavernicola]PJG59026.1 DUF2066 domain-containing protein [Aeromonas cavernicola]
MLKFVVMILCSCLPLTTMAVQLTDLYQGQAPMSSDTAAAQAKALEAVLLKVTGKRDVLTQPAVVKALAAPGDYVKRYGYQDQDSVKYLHAEFSSDKVNQLVSESQFALLGPVRPQVVLWLVVEQQGNKLLADQSSDGWAAVLREQAQMLGLPITIPLMDLDDNMAVSSTDVWGRFAEPILQASQRYGAEMVVLGKLSPDSLSEEGKWNIDWELFGPKAAGEVAELTRGHSVGTQAEVAQGFADHLANWLVQQYGARLSGPAASQRLVVDGLVDMNSMIAVQQLLQGMVNVSKVEIGQLTGDQATFTLLLQGGEAELVRGLQLESRLQRIDDNTGSLRYQWRP